MATSESVKKVFRRTIRLTITIVIVLLGIILLILVLIQTGPVQDYGRGKIEAYLENKLHTKVRIGHLSINFPSRIILKNVYLEDRRKDSLFFGARIEADISMLRLFRKEFQINNLDLDGISLKVNRRLPDSTFNFQFIEDAFSSSAEKAPLKKDTSGGFRFVIGNIHLHQIAINFVDDATGNDLFLSLGDFKTKVKTFDPAHQSYAIPEISLTDFSGNFRQYKPILVLRQVADNLNEQSKHANPLNLELGDILFTRVNIDYRDDGGNVDGSLRLGNLHMIADHTDLTTLHFKLSQISLNNTTAKLRYGKIKLDKTKTTHVNSVGGNHVGTWSFDVTKFAIDSTRFVYDDENSVALKKGIDYNHLDINHFSVKSSDLHVDPSNYEAMITSMAFDEKSGLAIKKLSTQFSYGTTGASLNNLVLQTSHSELKTRTSVKYRSLDDLKRHPGDMLVDVEFDRSRIAVRDIFVFVPSLEGPLKWSSGAILQLNGKLAGHLKDLKIPDLEMEGVGNTSLSVSGQIKGLPDVKNTYYDLSIKKLKTTREDIFRFVPSGSIPDNFRIPQSILVTGKFRGTYKRFFVQLHTLTGEGQLDLKGDVDLDRKTYDLVAHTRLLDLGYILKQDSLLGKVTLDMTAKGNGFVPNKMNSVFHLNLVDAVYKTYHYHGLILDANLENGSGHFVSSIQDPNLSYHLEADAGLEEKYPTLKIKLQLDTLNALALHLLPDSLQMRWILDADLSSTDPDALSGALSIKNIGLTYDNRSIYTDSIFINAHHSDTGQSIQLRSEAADIDWIGRFKLTQVPESIKQFLNHYYNMPALSPDSTEPEQWQMAIRMRASPMVLTLVPSLKGTDSLTGRVLFNSAKKDLTLDLHAGKIQINQLVFDQLHVMAASKGKGIDYNISVADAGQNGMRIYHASVYGTVADSKLAATLRIKDKKEKNKYLVSGSLSQINKSLRFTFNPDSLLLNYNPWQVPKNNFIEFDSAGLLVRNLNFTRESESLFINTAGQTTASPLDLQFTKFKISTFTQFADHDSLLLEGTVNGKAEVKNLFTSPLFTSDLKIDTLSYKKDTLGNLVLQVSNEGLNAFKAHIILKGQENDIQVDGKYFTGESKMDVKVKLNQLNLASFNGFVFSQVRNMKGYLKGELQARGNLDQPILKGSLHFDKAVVVPVLTGEPLKLLDDVINFDEGGFDFANFQMQDSSGSKATLDGNIFTKDFRNFQFDITFKAKNFRVINTVKEPNKLFYGKLNMDADIDVTGDDKLPQVVTYMRANKNTDFFVVLPSDDPEVVDREGVVIFTNNRQKADSVIFQQYLDSLASYARLTGMDFSGTIETDSDAQFTLIIDERDGDALTIRGRAYLTGGVDKSGKISLTGNYELVNGSYEITLSVLHRKFIIQRGSVITWTGDPQKANIDITAIYTVNTAPVDLLGRQINQNAPDALRFRQRLPFQVKLYMTGELLKPIIKFDIALPDNLLSLWPEVSTKLVQLRTDLAETNKQVFALLLLGRFVQENPFQTSGGGTDAGSIARQSASKILSDQLNQLAVSLIKGVDITFDLNSGQNYTSGTSLNQTDLSVKVSKNLFEDRIRVSVGSNFQLEQTNPGQNNTNLAGDMSVDYRLSKDGRYMIRVYRKDQYQYVVQGQVIETGLSFILTFDYNRFRELFENKKEKLATPVYKHKKQTSPEHNIPAK